MIIALTLWLVIGLAVSVYCCLWCKRNYSYTGWQHLAITILVTPFGPLGLLARVISARKHNRGLWN